MLKRALFNLLQVRVWTKNAPPRMLWPRSSVIFSGDRKAVRGGGQLDEPLAAIFLDMQEEVEIANTCNP